MSGTQKLGFCRTSRFEEFPSLAAFVDRMIRITDEIVDQIKECQLDGEYYFPANSYDDTADEEPTNFSLFMAMLAERPEIAEVDYADDNELYVVLKSEFAVYEDDNHRRKLTQDEVDVICAKHTLWLHNDGGERADFTDCLLKRIDISKRELDQAIFTGAKLVDCDLSETRLNGADFSNVKMYHCRAAHIQAKNATFKGALIQMCDLAISNLLHSNFSHVTFQDTDGCHCNMNYCCFDGTSLEGLCSYGAKMNNISKNEAAWLASHRKSGLISFDPTRKKE